MPVVEPNVSMEKLYELLNEQHESETLDYKRMCDLSQTRDVVELAKDVGAMQIDGGFIVIGADDRGKPTGELGEKESRLLDESRLRKKLAKYVLEPFDLRAAVHELEGGERVAVIYVGPNPAGFCIFKADGNYEGVGSPAFRMGDVFARHGSASEPWAQPDIARIVRSIVAREKESWRQEYREELQIR